MDFLEILMKNNKHIENMTIKSFYLFLDLLKINEKYNLNLKVYILIMMIVKYN